MKRTRQLEQAALARLQERLAKKDSLRQEYAAKPRELLAKYGYLFPGPLREMFDDVYEERVNRAVGLGPRGGGKSYLAAGLGFALFLLKEWNVGVVSGSKEQALRVMEYVQDITGDEEVTDYVEDETKTLVRGKSGNWVKAAPASTKAIRGLHAKGRPMLLILDEEAEMAPDIVRAALKVVKDARPSVVLRLSTMHKVSGTFVNLVLNHAKQGYALYRWDSFDVCTRCRTSCKRCLEAYAKAYRPEEIAELTKSFHGTYCRERAKQGEGWIAVNEIRQAFMESPVSWFETEDMAMRPSGEGMVLDPEKVRAAFEGATVSPVRGAPKWGWVDWGFKGQMAAGVFQQVGDEVHLLAANDWTGVDVEMLITWFRGLEADYGERLCEIDPDSSHPFENNRLREAGWETVEVVFGAYKETGAGMLRWLFDRGRLLTAGRFPRVMEQLLAWSRGADGRIKKGNDHYCDGMLAGMKRMSDAAGRRGYMGPVRLPSVDENALDGLFENQDRALGGVLG